MSRPSNGGAIMISVWRIVLVLLAVWVVVSVIGLVLEGLFWLFVIGLVLFLVTSLVGWLGRSR